MRVASPGVTRVPSAQRITYKPHARAHAPLYLYPLFECTIRPSPPSSPFSDPPKMRRMKKLNL